MADVRYARWDRVLMGDGHYSMVAVDVTDEIAALRQRVSTLQEVVRQMDACWQTSRTPWQSGSPCHAEYLAATHHKETTP